MIHIMRENETVDELEYIYGIKKEDIISHNLPDTIFSSNSAVYIPLEEDIYFAEDDIHCSELKDILNIGAVFPEGKSTDGVIRKNTRINTNIKISCDKRFFSGIYDLRDINSDFVAIDRKNHLFSEIYLNCYETQNGDIPLPGDYPAINACRIGGMRAGIYLDDIERYSGEEMLMKIKQDMMYKDYESVLINVKNPAQTQTAVLLTDFFGNMGLKVKIKGSEMVLKNIKYENYDTLYYSSRKNIFDFSSFTDIVSSLLESIPQRFLGYELKLCAADIRREDMKISYPDMGEVRKIFYENDCRISYDEVSKLCFFKTDAPDRHNILYEDLRGIYSKAAYLKEKGIEKFISSSLDEPIIISAYEGLMSV